MRQPEHLAGPVDAGAVDWAAAAGQVPEVPGILSAEQLITTGRAIAASPPVASRLGLDPFYFVIRHVLYVIPAIAVMLATSFLPPRHVRRLARRFQVSIFCWPQRCIQRK
jgi:hypothetical protein